MSDEPKTSKKPIAVIAIVLLLLALLGAWLFVKSRHKTPNLPPIAVLHLDSVDETNRVILLSDSGSRDPDGTLQSWLIAWGDGKEDALSSIPQKKAHTYASEGEYKISLSCVDNLGATSSPPAMTNITFDFLKRQKALEQAQAEAKREADRLKEEAARKEAQRLEQERQKQMELAAAQEAQKAREQAELEAKRKAEAERARQTTIKAAETPPPTPLAAALTDGPDSRKVIYTPSGFALGDYQICKEKTEGKENNGNLLVILATRCVNFPETPIPTLDWQIDGKGARVKASRIRASLTPGHHELTAILTPKGDLPGMEIKASVTVQTNGDCVVIPGK